MKIYEVGQGWISYVWSGSRIEKRYSDNPCVWDCDTEEEARAIFDEIDIAQIYRTERMCAGRGFYERDAYKTIEVYEMMCGVCKTDNPSECEWLEYVETIAFDTYGSEQYEGEE